MSDFCSISSSVRCALALAAATIVFAPDLAQAEFAEGNEVYIQGVAGPENGYTYWGSNVNGQTHALGDSSQLFADSFNSAYYVSVSSVVLSSTKVGFSISFFDYNPGQYSLHALEIIGLKNDGSISSVTASQGIAVVQAGNKIRWDGNGVDLAYQPKLVLIVEQVPAPGAIALLGVAGLAGSRRRRA